MSADSTKRDPAALIAEARALCAKPLDVGDAISKILDGDSPDCDFVIEARVLLPELAEALDRSRALMPCGHPGACAVVGAEGSAFCGACEDRERRLLASRQAYELAARRADEAGRYLEHARSALRAAHDELFAYGDTGIVSADDKRVHRAQAVIEAGLVGSRPPSTAEALTFRKVRGDREEDA